MALLEKVEALKRDGKNDVEIINSLKNEGYSPRDISEAFSQMKIKAAVANDIGGNNPETWSSSQENAGEMQASIMNAQNYSSNLPQQAIQDYPEQPQNFQQNLNQANNQQYANYTNQAIEYAPADYGQQADNSGYYSQTLDIETVRDIANQEIEEKTKILKEKVEQMTKEKMQLKFELQSVENRLIKIENVIQEIQSAIIGKIGEYGEAVSSISEELKETQKTFSKLVNPLIDRARGKEENEDESEEKNFEETETLSKKEKKPIRQKANSKDVSFEDYLR